MSCSRCNLTLSADEIKWKINCDFCGLAHCLACSRLTTTETRCTQLTTRTLLFVCAACRLVKHDHAGCTSENLVDGFARMKSDMESLLVMKMDKLTEGFNREIQNLKTVISDLTASNVKIVTTLQSTATSVPYVKSPRSSNKKVSKNCQDQIISADAVKQTLQNVNKQILESKQRKVMQNLIDNNTSYSSKLIKGTIHTNLRAGSTGNETNSGEGSGRTVIEQGNTPSTSQLSVTADEFIPVKLRRKARSVKKPVVVGTAVVAPSEDAFMGREANDKKAWLFVSRVKDGIDETIVKDYIKRKAELDDKDVVVKRIETSYEKKDSNCFQVGIKFELKDQLYEVDFWPKGVAFRRFNFNFARRENGTNSFLDPNAT